MGGRSSKDKESSSSCVNGTGALETNENSIEQRAQENLSLHTEAVQSVCTAGEGELFSGGVDKVRACTTNHGSCTVWVGIHQLYPNTVCLC